MTVTSFLIASGILLILFILTGLFFQRKIKGMKVHYTRTYTGKNNHYYENGKVNFLFILVFSLIIFACMMINFIPVWGKIIH